MLWRLSHLFPYEAWFIFGDFNEIHNDDEKSEGRLRPVYQMERFNQVVDDCSL